MLSLFFVTEDALLWRHCFLCSSWVVVFSVFYFLENYLIFLITDQLFEICKFVIFVTKIIVNEIKILWITVKGKLLYIFNQIK